MLSGMSSLTCLQVKGLWGSSVLFEPGALVGKTQLRQLKIRGCSIAGGSAGVEQLLFNIQQLKQLTYLNLKWSLNHNYAGPDAASIAPAEAYSALTASSNLQHLDVSVCTLPAGSWQHIFPADRQLPHLTSLRINDVCEPAANAAVLKGDRVFSCCPGLRALRMARVWCSSELLASLSKLSGLQDLVMGETSSEV
jgi:hypothetical protein